MKPRLPNAEALADLAARNPRAVRRSGLVLGTGGLTVLMCIVSIIIPVLISWLDYQP